MRCSVSAIAIVLVGCGASTDGRNGGSATSPERPAAAACPRPEALDIRVRTAFALENAERLEVTACVPGHYGAGGDGWLIEALVDHGKEPDVRHIRWRGILGRSGDGVIVRGEATDVPEWYAASSQSAWSARDLDGDGVDELIAATTSDLRGVVMSSLALLRVAGDQLEMVKALPLGFDSSAAANDGDGDDTAAVVCGASHALESTSRGIEIVVTGDTPAAVLATAADKCPPAGVHRYALAGGALAEVAATVQIP